jgi:hypothetical protein
MPRAGGESVLVAKGFSYSVAVAGGYAYGVTCDAKKSFDTLVRVTVSGGNVEPFAEIEHTKPPEQDPGTFACNYSSLVADDKAVYLTHWNGRRVLRVDLESRATTTLAIRASYPSDLYLEDVNLVFRASGGVYRGSKTEANAVLITDLGSAPFTMVVYDPKALFTHQSDPYATEECTYEVSWSTGKSHKRDCFKAERPDEFPPDVGVRGIAVDDECIYTMRKHQKYTALYARSYPARTRPIDGSSSATAQRAFPRRTKPIDDLLWLNAAATRVPQKRGLRTTVSRFVPAISASARMGRSRLGQTPQCLRRATRPTWETMLFREQTAVCRPSGRAPR